MDRPVLRKKQPIPRKEGHAKLIKIPKEVIPIETNYSQTQLKQIILKPN